MALSWSKKVEILSPRVFLQTPFKPCEIHVSHTKATAKPIITAPSKQTPHHHALCDISLRHPFQTSTILFVRPNFIDTSTIHQTHIISFKLPWNKFWNIFLVFHRLPIQPLFRTVQTTTSRCDGFQSFTGRRVSCLIGSYDQCFWFRSSLCGWICLDWWLLSSLIERERCPCWWIWKLCRPYEIISVNHNVDFELTQLEKRAWISFEHHHYVVTYSKTRLWIPIFNSTLLFRFRICEFFVSILFGLLSVFMQVMSLIQGLDLILFMSRHRQIPYCFDYATITGCSSVYVLWG